MSEFQNQFPSGGMLVEIIANHLPSHADSRGFGEVVDRLIWLLDEDTAREMLVTLRSWIQSKDRRLVLLALSIESVFLIEDVTEMDRLANAISANFPELGARATGIASRQREQSTC